MLVSFIRPKYIRLLCRVIPNVSMSMKSKRDHEAIMTYNKLRKQPLQDTTYPANELRLAKKFFENIREFRRRAEEGFEPSKLFMVWRIGELSGRPVWEKDLMIELGLVNRKSDYAIVKNTPSMNKKLWTVKHLIRIRPITFPNGFPQEEDYASAFLKQTGELIVTPKLKVDTAVMERDPDQEKKKLNYRIIKADLKRKWEIGYPHMY